MSRMMYELCPLLCLKLYSMNYAIAHVQKYCYAIRIGHACGALKHKINYFSLETSAGISFEFIKFVKNCKLSPFDENK